MNFLKNKVFLRIIGLFIFIYILTKLDLSQTFDILKNLNWKYFILGLILFIPHILIKIYRWHRILYFQKIKLGFKELSHPYISTYGLGIITPWKVGELTRISYLRKKNISLGMSSFSVFLDRLLDVILFILVGVISMLFLLSFFKEYLIITALFLLATIVISFFIIYKRELVLKLIIKLLPKKFKEKTHGLIFELWKEFKKINISFIIEAILITAFSWLFFYLEVYLFSIALNIDLTLIETIILVSISSIANLLPISISGIGTRDATFIFLFSIFGFTSEQALALSLLILIMWAINAFFCMLFWWKKPIELINENGGETNAKLGSDLGKDIQGE